MPSTPKFHKPLPLRDCHTPISKRQRLSTDMDSPKSLLNGSFQNETVTEDNSPIVKSMNVRRTEKRRSLIQASPARAMSPALDPRRESVKLSNEQLVNHYQNCMKLSTENKITSKNAFNLHLIDHMDEMLKERYAGSSLNFMEAGGTIYASAKIYASRVDAVYSEAFRVLNSLGMHSTEKGATEEETENTDGVSQPVPSKRRKKRSAILEPNRNNICSKEMELSAQYDMLNIADIASSDGQIINNLEKIDDAIALFFHSITRKMKAQRNGSSFNPTKDKMEEEALKANDPENEKCDAKDQSLIQNECGIFYWNSTGIGQIKNDFKPEKLDWDATVSAKNSQDPFQNDELSSQDDLFENNPTAASPQSGQNNMEIDDFEPLDDDNSPLSPANDVDADNILNYTTGVNADTTANVTMGEYSYFKSNALSLGDGPSHWKHKAQKKPLSKDPSAPTAKSGKGKRKVFQMEFVGNCDCENFKCKESVKTKESKEKWKDPSEERLCKFASKEKISDTMKYCSISQLKATPFTSLLKRTIDPPILETENYNYDNENDANFCPGDPGEDNTEDGGFDLGATMFDATAFPDTQQTDYMDMLKSDENLVNQIEIAYAKTAKRVDVRKLKSAMWSFIEPPDEPMEEQPQCSKTGDVSVTEDADKSNITSKSEVDEKEVDKTELNQLHADTFTELYNHLPNKLPSKMQQNLSIPLAFTCLLYLANEKKLKLDGSEDMSDIKIMLDSDI